MLSAYRIGCQGRFNGSGFTFKARGDAVEISIDSNTSFIDSLDNNSVAQILMFRFSDSYLNDIPRNNITLPLNSVVEIWLNIDISNQDRPIHWDTMVAGNRLLKYLYIIDSISGGMVDNEILTPALKDSLLGRISKHIDILINKDFSHINNHSLQAMHALVGVARSGLAELSLKEQSERLENAINSLFNDEGFYMENSTEYHFYSLQLLDSFTSSGWYENTGLTCLLAKANEFSNTLYASENEIFGFGDSDKDLLKRQIRNGVIACKEVNEGVYIKPISGMATSRIKNKNEISSLILINQYNGDFHNHHDYLSLEWLYKSWWIISDPGKFTYNKSEYKDWFLSERAHNSYSLSKLEHSHKTSHKIISGGDDGSHYLIGQIFDESFSVTRQITHKFDAVYITDVIYIYESQHNRGIESFLTISYEFNNVIYFDGKKITLSNKSKECVIIISDMPFTYHYGSDEPISGWVAPKYGEKESAIQLKFTHPNGTNIIKNSITITVLEANDGNIK